MVELDDAVLLRHYGGLVGYVGRVVIGVGSLEQGYSPAANHGLDGGGILHELGDLELVLGGCLELVGAYLALVELALGGEPVEVGDTALGLGAIAEESEAGTDEDAEVEAHGGGTAQRLPRGVVE